MRIRGEIRDPELPDVEPYYRVLQLSFHRTRSLVLLSPI